VGRKAEGDSPGDRGRGERARGGIVGLQKKKKKSTHNEKRTAQKKKGCTGVNDLFLQKNREGGAASRKEKANGLKQPSKLRGGKKRHGEKRVQ